MLLGVSRLSASSSCPRPVPRRPQLAPPSPGKWAENGQQAPTRCGEGPRCTQAHREPAQGVPELGLGRSGSAPHLPPRACCPALCLVSRATDMLPERSWMGLWTQDSRGGLLVSESVGTSRGIEGASSRSLAAPVSSPRLSGTGVRSLVDWSAIAHGDSHLTAGVPVRNPETAALGRVPGRGVPSACLHLTPRHLRWDSREPCLHSRA